MVNIQLNAQAWHWVWGDYHLILLLNSDIKATVPDEFIFTEVLKARAWLLVVLTARLGHASLTCQISQLIVKSTHGFIHSGHVWMRNNSRPSVTVETIRFSLNFVLNKVLKPWTTKQSPSGLFPAIIDPLLTLPWSLLRPGPYSALVLTERWPNKFSELCGISFSVGSHLGFCVPSPDPGLLRKM